MKDRRYLSRILALTALLVCALFVLTGCGENLFPNMQQAVEQAAQSDDEPEATRAPFTAEMYTDREALYQYYNDVTFADTLETLTERYGEPEVSENENGSSYTWSMDDGYGFVCVFFDNGKMRAKALLYEDARQFGAISKSTGLSNVTQLNKNVTFEMCRGILAGRGMEIMQVAQDTSADPEINRVFDWVDEPGENVVQVLFNGQEQLESVSYSFAEDE